MSTAIHKPITMRALLQRINRQLAKHDEVLKTLRGQRYAQDLGQYYSVNYATNLIAATHVDPVAWGRELGVLAAWEVVEEAEMTGSAQTL
jgi:hypothetical protein